MVAMGAWGRPPEEVTEGGDDPMKDGTESSSVLQCRRCGSKDVSVEQKQTRSADEAMTLFICCLACNARWKH